MIDTNRAEKLSARFFGILFNRMHDGLSMRAQKYFYRIGEKQWI